MIKISRSTNCKVVAKKISVTNGSFVDFETGEELDIASIISENIGDGVPFDLSAIQKNEEIE